MITYKYCNEETKTHKWAKYSAEPSEARERDSIQI
jgi:hypothetical protein